METNIYLYTAVGATTVFVVKLLMMLFVGDGVDTDLDGDLSDDVNGAESFELISLQSVMTFLMIFGWTALAFRNEFMMSKAQTILGSSGVGLVGAYLFSLAVFKLKKLTTEEVKALDLKEGMTGEVYSNIPKKNNGYGQVKIKVSGQVRYLNAYSEENEIKTGSTVSITKTNPLTVKKENK